MGGPVGVLVGVVVGVVVGAVTAVGINGSWNIIERKEFFYNWKNAAKKGAISGGIAGGFAAYRSIYSTNRSISGFDSDNDSIDEFRDTFDSRDICIREGRADCFSEGGLFSDPADILPTGNAHDRNYEMFQNSIDRLLRGF